MEKLPSLTGVTLDVPALLQELSPTDLVSAVKGAISKKPQASSAVYYRSGAMSINVSELLRGLDRKQLLVVVRNAVEPHPVIKNELVRELQHLLGGPLQPGEHSASVVKLPQIGHGSRSLSTSSPGTVSVPCLHSGGPGRPPRIPSSQRLDATNGANNGAWNRRGNSRGNSRGNLPLPRLPEHSPAHQVAGGLGDPTCLGERLRQAIIDKDGTLMQALILARADLDAKNCDGATASALAIVQGTPHVMLRSVLDAKADVHSRDGQGRSLAHIWSWSLQKSRAGMHEAQKKLTILEHFGADLNARLPVTGETPLHVLAKVFNTMSRRAADGADLEAHREVLGGVKDAEKLVKGVSLRIHLLVTARADLSVRNAVGRRPFDLVEKRFQPALPQLISQDATPSGGESLSPKSYEGTGVDKARGVRLDQAQELS